MALFAMRCVKELGLPLKHGCRLIMGTDEESGSEDLPYYYSKHAPAPNTFTPDSGFPVYNVEKGLFRPVVKRSWASEIRAAAGHVDRRRLQDKRGALGRGGDGRRHERGRGAGAGRGRGRESAPSS